MLVWYECYDALLYFTPNYCMTLWKTFMFDTLLNNKQTITTLDCRSHKNKVSGSTSHIDRSEFLVHQKNVLIETIDNS
jgi:hypothetical protein